MVKYSNAKIKYNRNNDKVKFIKKECLQCRRFGHVLKDCPEGIKLVCIRCGDPSHTVNNCSKEYNDEDPTPYAQCFICRQIGHISSKCPENCHGVYPKGGSCYRCSSIYHLAKDCEMKDDFLKQKRLNRQNKRHNKSNSVENIRNVSEKKSFEAADQSITKRPRGTRGGKRVQEMRSKMQTKNENQ